MSEIYNKLKQEKYVICIPSRKREFMYQKGTGIWKYFKGKERMYPLYLFLLKMETENYLKSGMTAINFRGMKNDSTIADKRGEMINGSYKNNPEYLFIIDDDVVLYHRDESLSSKYKSKFDDFVTEDSLNKLLYESIQLCGEKYPIVGIPNKQGSASLKYMFPKNIPIIRFVCYHLPTLYKHDIKVNEMGVSFMSDRYVQLKLLSLGYRSLSNCRFAVNDYGTGYKGGCSETRDVKAQSESAIELQKRFPKNIELKKKSDGKWNEERLDCKINWKGFLDDGELPYVPKEDLNYV